MLDLINAVYETAHEALGHGFFALVTPNVSEDYVVELWRRGVSYSDGHRCREVLGELRDVALSFWNALGYVREMESELCVVRVGD